MRFKFIFTLMIFVCICFMSIGYAALNINLTISGEAIATALRTIKITNISIKEQLNGSYETYNSNYTNNTTTTFVTLPNQNSSITLEIEITNETSANYHIDFIDTVLNTNPNISYTILNEEILFFKPNSISTFEITFYYKNVINDNNNISLSLEYNFIQVPYEKLEYITSTGTQYIDTGIMNTGDYVFESEFLPAFDAKGEGVWLFSGRKITSQTVGLYLFISSTYNFTINSYGGSTGSNSSIRLPKDTWYNMYFSRNLFTINSINIPVFPESGSANILLGGNLVNWDGSVDTRQFEGDIKYFKITDAITGETVRYFIPVKLVDTGEIGYLDLVEDKFYSNIGTGNFLEP